MSEKFITPEKLPSPYEREILIILMEECAEIQHRAAKALRFGLAEVQHGQDASNRVRLSREIGDLDAVFELAMSTGIISMDAIAEGVERKQKKLKKYMQTAPDC